MKTLITVDCKKWFDRVNGNTYHNVKVSIKNSKSEKESFESGLTYGYDDHYKQTAGELLSKNTSLLKEFKTDYLGNWGLIEKLKEKGIEVAFHEQDVNTERELKF